MKRRFASLFHRLGDYLDPSRRDVLQAVNESQERSLKCQLDLLTQIGDLREEVEKLRAEVTPVAVPEHAPDWEAAHMLAWRNFLASPAGQVLILRGRAIQFLHATNACKDVFHTSHSAGSAKGFGECLDWLNSLSRASRVQDDAPAGDNQPKTDTSPKGESELREAMSP